MLTVQASTNGRNWVESGMSASETEDGKSRRSFGAALMAGIDPNCGRNTNP